MPDIMIYFLLYSVYWSLKLLCLTLFASVFQEAMNVVHISKEDQDNVFAMLAAVLWLGNISFTVIDNENHVEVVTDEGIIFMKYLEKQF